ncbi:hypothetical protein [Paenibacillus monticola]|uniref:Uncharacterized protein n=1 Tax=Paenibacillus monticola TaxID=2666075 RepID=A0A7X2H5I5_9BACL|nr:hypothetical protein [Paenibacillus monticola]MRN53956.1 hypothetical protein [Paenibacillus monticola]
MKSKSFAGFMIKMALLGLCIGLLLFILTQSGVFELPIVIGTTSYEGMKSSLLLLIGSPIVLIIIGFVISIFMRSESEK